VRAFAAPPWLAVAWLLCSRPDFEISLALPTTAVAAGWLDWHRPPTPLEHEYWFVGSRQRRRLARKLQALTIMEPILLIRGGSIWQQRFHQWQKLHRLTV